MSAAEKDRGFIVQLNNKIIKRDQWKDHTIHESDIIELITLVGGG
jgi:thiamine biosynthesis protein ThiS